MSGPGGWNYLDSLEVGNSHRGIPLTPSQSRAHFSLWALVKSPMLIGCDLTTMSDDTKAILMNKEVIAISQDGLGLAGRRVATPTATTEIWSGIVETESGSVVVLLLNTGPESTSITVNWSDIDLSKGTQVAARDVWAHADAGVHTDSFTAQVASHDVVMVIFQVGPV